MIFIIALVILFLDQLSKFILSGKLSLHQSVPVIKNIFHLTLVHNYGAAFGLLKNQTLLFIGTSLVVIILISVDSAKNRRNEISLYTFSLGCILAGAIGNLIDRIRFGYVVDFLDFRVWPVFNIADSAITIGACLLGYSILRKKE